mmetsp:Transcript_132843/g.425161  ORF Transcript_132843/g.425161 Transcript_132843/m.425161 type:complete len:277 (+) Transcript_132843:238-1068(+)
MRHERDADARAQEGRGSGCSAPLLRDVACGDLLAILQPRRHHLRLPGLLRRRLPHELRLGPELLLVRGLAVFDPRGRLESGPRAQGDRSGCSSHFLCALARGRQLAVLLPRRERLQVRGLLCHRCALELRLGPELLHVQGLAVFAHRLGARGARDHEGGEPAHLLPAFARGRHVAVLHPGREHLQVPGLLRHRLPHELRLGPELLLVHRHHGGPPPCRARGGRQLRGLRLHRCIHGGPHMPVQLAVCRAQRLLRGLHIQVRTLSRRRRGSTGLSAT